MWDQLIGCSVKLYLFYYNWVRNDGNWSPLFLLLLCYLAAYYIIDLLLLTRCTCNISITYVQGFIFAT